MLTDSPEPGRTPHPDPEVEALLDFEPVIRKCVRHPQLGRHDGEIATGPPLESQRTGSHLSDSEWRRRQEEKQALAAEAQQVWEAKARAEAEAWAKRGGRGWRRRRCRRRGGRAVKFFVPYASGDAHAEHIWKVSRADLLDLGLPPSTAASGPSPST
ncbi:MAG TPA: hypothetical protein VGB04_04580 [Allosphingosinicella sp.]|jgi:hypothetical protein